jgi:hypothetical protein
MLVNGEETNEKIILGYQRHHLFYSAQHPFQRTKCTYGTKTRGTYLLGSFFFLLSFFGYVRGTKAP